MMPAFAPSTQEAEFARMASMMDGATLLQLLNESHPVYNGRSENATMRMRGWVFACLAAVGMTDSRILPYLREELETGYHAYIVAAAAVALRGVIVPSAEWVPIVEAALDRIRWSDDRVQFERYPLNVIGTARTTAVEELQKTLVRLRQSEAASDSPSLPLQFMPLAHFRRKISVRDMELEDHAGRRLTYGEYFLGRPSFLLFFYTRCNTPNKCSTNIVRWGELQRQLAAQRLTSIINLAAITYDPEFDLPERLLIYASERNVALDDRARVFRVPQGFAEFQRFFALQVNYAQTTVNRHAREAFLLDASGVIVSDFVRVEWDVAEIVHRLRELSDGVPPAV